MKAVCFLRHGPAADEEPRPLTPEGREKTERAARGIARLDLGIDAVLSSPLPRALETAEILARVLGLPKPRTSDLLLPDADAERLLPSLRAAVPALVGHEPSLSRAVSRLIGGGAVSLKKAGMAFVETTSASRGTLRLLLPPAVLRALQ